MKGWLGLVALMLGQAAAAAVVGVAIGSAAGAVVSARMLPLEVVMGLEGLGG
jgi:hypothetical protein